MAQRISLRNSRLKEHLTLASSHQAWWGFKQLQLHRLPPAAAAPGPGGRRTAPFPSSASVSSANCLQTQVPRGTSTPDCSQSDLSTASTRPVPSFPSNPSVTPHALRMKTKILTHIEQPGLPTSPSSAPNGTSFHDSRANYRPPPPQASASLPGCTPRVS